MNQQTGLIKKTLNLHNEKGFKWMLCEFKQVRQPLEGLELYQVKMIMVLVD